MKKFSRLARVAFVSLTLSACAKHGDKPNPESAPKAPPVQAPDASASRDLQNHAKPVANKVCKRTESSQYFSSEALTYKAVLAERVESRELDQVDCGGQVYRARRPVRWIERAIIIDAPAAIERSAVQAVRVENQRTCVAMTVPAGRDADLQDEIELSDGQTIRMSPLATKVGHSGALKLVVTDGDNRSSPGFLRVADGMNAVRIFYLDAEGKNIGSRDIAIELRVDRPQVPGRDLVNICR